MKPKESKCLEEAVRVGAIRGVRKAYKHNDSPTEEQIASAVERTILEEIDEWFTFEDEPPAV